VNCARPELNNIQSLEAFTLLHHVEGSQDEARTKKKATQHRCAASLTVFAHFGGLTTESNSQKPTGSLFVLIPQATLRVVTCAIRNLKLAAHLPNRNHLNILCIFASASRTFALTEGRAQLTPQAKNRAACRVNPGRSAASAGPALTWSLSLPRDPKVRCARVCA
jgi:hypothetical protein